MNQNGIKLLIVEDHNIIARAYENILNDIPNVSFNILFAKNCDEAIEKIQRIKNSNSPFRPPASNIEK